MTDHAMRENAASQVPGEQARTPTQIPARGWVQVIKRGWKEASEDQVSLLGAGVAFFGFLALFPALAAFTLLYGLVADPATIASQTQTLTASLPPEARTLLVGQLDQLASAPQQSLGWGLALAIVLALWSASGGVGNLITAVNIAYDEKKKRGFVKEKLLALGVTVGAVIFMALIVALMAGVPIVLGFVDVNGPLRWVIEVVRWVLLAVLVMLALAVLYRVAPDRDAPKFRWVSAGAVVATVLWLVASAAFSLYVTFFGNYAKTYGALAGVVLMMLWLWLTSYAILLGAEINAESEEQTVKDTTTGTERPLGSRGAVKADSTPPPAR
ncbi:MAG TPA: YihY/virulence factor BrkB family protein [Propionicimonas sp.]|jgi:membrane protein|uniref:YihY/virulence factor BrkB family protein n=1 Tax=Propionicimonas sp. TaxID=1955623 RepID=UPI002F417620